MQSKFVTSVMASLLSLALCVPESIPSSAVPPTVAPILLKAQVGNVAEPVVRRRMAGGEDTLAAPGAAVHMRAARMRAAPIRVLRIAAAPIRVPRIATPTATRIAT